MKLDSFKTEYIGKTIKLIGDLKSDGYKSIKREFDIDDEYHSFDQVKIIFFDEDDAIVFIDQDCDGYRSGAWDVGKVKLLCEAGLENIKPINSEILDIKKYEKGGKTGLIIYTKEYVIDMGQDNSDSYYPSNYFDVSELETGIVGKGELLELD